MTRYLNLFVLLSSLIAASACTAEAPSKPNVVMFIADDLGWADVGYQGSEIRTPSIDSLAANGVTLNRFYAHPVCSPTRGAIMTGRSPLNTGVMTPFEPWYELGTPLDEKLMPQYFKDAGYQTFALGKWHLGPNHTNQYPQNRGFDHFYGHLNGFLNYNLHTIWRSVDWQRNGETVVEEGYTTHLIADEAVRLIESRDKTKPMFLYVSFNAPHTPLQAPEEAIAEYADIEDPNRRTYAAMVTEMDTAIGRIRAAIEAENIAKNTLVLFMSDNGGNAELGASNTPLRGGKGFVWEGGIRVPAAIYWPGKLQAGTTYDGRVTVEDLLPTFAAAAGFELDAPKPLDGRDVWPGISGGAETTDRDAVMVAYEREHYQLAYFSEHWKLVQTNDRGQDPQYYLFDVRNDSIEQADLSGELPVVFARLKAELDALPKAQAVTFGQRRPDRNQPGSPRAIAADDRPADKPPYTETARTD
jgi:arylsulfatase A-like enzyme